MRHVLLACCLGFAALVAPLIAQVSPQTPTDTMLSPEETKKMQTAFAMATSAPASKTAQANLLSAVTNRDKAARAHQDIIEKTVIQLDPTAAPLVEKNKRLQQEAIARRNAGLAVKSNATTTTPSPASPAPKAPAETPLTTGEANKLMPLINRANATPEGKAAYDNLSKAREDLAKATEAFKEATQKVAIAMDPTTAPLFEKANRLQREAVARRNANNASSQGGQPNVAQPNASAIPRPSELFDNWITVGVLIALGIAVIVVLLMRKRG